MSDIRSWVARNIAQRTRSPPPPHRRLPQLRKKFKFGETWITLNRTLGEALKLDDTSRSEKRSKRHHAKQNVKPATRIGRKRRDATTVIDLSTRLMSNGHTWPTRNDWLIGADKKVHYAPALRHLRRLKSVEWFGKNEGNRSKKSLALTVRKSRDVEDSERSEDCEAKESIIFGSTRLGAIVLCRDKLVTDDGASTSTAKDETSEPTVMVERMETTGSASGHDYKSLLDADSKSTSDPELKSVSERDYITATSDSGLEERTVSRKRDDASSSDGLERKISSRQSSLDCLPRTNDRADS